MASVDRWLLIFCTYAAVRDLESQCVRVEPVLTEGSSSASSTYLKNLLLICSAPHVAAPPVAPPPVAAPHAAAHMLLHCGSGSGSGSTQGSARLPVGVLHVLDNCCTIGV